MTIRKRHVLAAIIVCAAIGFFVDRKFFADPWTASECDKLEKASVATPDGSRLAKHVFFACGAGLTEQIWDAVVIVRHGESPVKGDEVWAGGKYSRDRIELSWHSSDQLQVTLPNESVTLRQKTSLAGVAIEFKFNPDDPIARQEFLAKRDSR